MIGVLATWTQPRKPDGRVGTVMKVPVADGGWGGWTERGESVG